MVLFIENPEYPIILIYLLDYGKWQIVALFVIFN
jgi:hypothetical protein